MPFSRLARNLPFPNVSIETCVNSISPQTISNKKIIFTETTDPYAIFIDENLKLTSWSGRFTLLKLFEIDLQKKNETNHVLHTVITGN